MSNSYFMPWKRQLRHFFHPGKQKIRYFFRRIITGRTHKVYHMKMIQRNNNKIKQIKVFGRQSQFCAAEVFCLTPKQDPWVFALRQWQGLLDMSYILRPVPGGCTGHRVVPQVICNADGMHTILPGKSSYVFHCLLWIATACGQVGMDMIIMIY